jgi:hypothetical protein
MSTRAEDLRLQKMGSSRPICIRQAGRPIRPAPAGLGASGIGEVRPDVGALLAADLTSEQGLDIGQPDIVGPSSGTGRGRMAAPVILTVDKQTAHAGIAHLARGDFLWSAGEGGHDPAARESRQGFALGAVRESGATVFIREPFPSMAVPNDRLRPPSMGTGGNRRF